MDKIGMHEAAGKAGVGVAQFRNLSREAGITPSPGWMDTPAGRRLGSFFSPEDVDKVLDLRRRKLRARSIAAAKVRWGESKAKRQKAEARKSQGQRRGGKQDGEVNAGAKTPGR